MVDYPHPMALDGLKVVELAQGVSGPYCAKVLADLGAQVIKTEPPGSGDVARTRGPFPGDSPDADKSALFLYLNANKLGVTLDVANASGRVAFEDLVRWADVLVEANPPKVMEDWGLDYSSLKALHAGLVVTSITPFGQSGPYRDYKGYNLNTYLMGGPGYLGGDVGPEDTPLKAGGQQSDFFAGVSAAAATMLAVYRQQATGQGEHVDVSALEGMVSILEAQIQGYSYWGKTDLRTDRVSIGPTPLVPCKDGFFYFNCAVESQWHGFRRLLGDPDWAHSGLFDSFLGRQENIDALVAATAEWFAHRTKEQAYRESQAHRLPFAPVNDMKDLVESLHLAAREYFVETEHPSAGPLRSPGAPYRLSRTPWNLRRPAPSLGQHNREVYLDILGYSEEKLAGLIGEGAV